MRFLAKNTDTGEELQFAVDDVGGYAVNAEGMVTHYVAPGTIQEFIANVTADDSPETQRATRDELDKTCTQIYSEHGDFVLDPMANPMRVDRFALICEESNKLASSDEIGKGIVEIGKGIVEMSAETLGDMKWCDQMIRKKFGADTEMMPASQEIVDALKEIAAERGLDGLPPPQSPQRRP